MPHYWPSLTALSYNLDDPGNELYAALEQLEQYRDPTTTAFTFKMVWPDTYNRFLQVSNPVTSLPGTAAVGYQPISVLPVTNPGAVFGGLVQSNGGSVCLIDGDANPSTFFFALGTYADWNGGIPGPSAAAVSQVELRVLNSSSSSGLHHVN